jgi:3-dehydroquinate synthase
MDQFMPDTGKYLTTSTYLQIPTPYFFGYQIEDELINKFKEYEFDRLFLFAEKHMYELYAKRIYEKLSRSFGKVILNLLPVGESNKSFQNLEIVCTNLIAQGASKKSILVSFGGGSVGNLVGMAAGLMYRGIRFVEIPTTFTGQTDSTLSNKQAINSALGKNHFGFYYAPMFIWSDTQYLLSEPEKSTKCGLIEGIKNGFISNADFLTYLYEQLDTNYPYSIEKLHNLAYNIINSKLEILKKDPTEKHYGIILEYGHTFGHAIEWLMHGQMAHGEAVSIGMKMAALLSMEVGLLKEAEVKLHYDIINNRLKFNTALPSSITAQKILDAMEFDNKKTGNSLRFILLEKIGVCHNPDGDYLVDVNHKLVLSIIENFIKNNN